MGAINYGTSDYISIGLNVSRDFDDCTEKRDAQKEITEIKRFLLDCTAAGLVQYFPGWCTGYSTAKETRAAINAAIKEMRQEVQTTPTYRQYNAA